MKNIDSITQKSQLRDKRAQTLENGKKVLPSQQKKPIFVLFQYKTNIVRKSMRKNRLLKHLFGKSTLEGFFLVKT